MAPECIICYRRRTQVAVLTCGHQTCTQCWQRWKRKEKRDFGRDIPTCPLCRAPQGPPEPARGALFLLAFVFWFLMSRTNPA